MDSIIALEKLAALKVVLSNEISGIQEKVTAAGVAEKLLIEGYSIDQVRIDADIQKGKDAIAADLAAKAAAIIEKDGIISSKDIELAEKVTAVAQHLETIDLLNATIVAKDAEIAELKTPIAVITSK